MLPRHWRQTWPRWLKARLALPPTSGAAIHFLGGSSGDADDSVDKGFPAIGADTSVIFVWAMRFSWQLTAQGALNFLGNADDDELELGGAMLRATPCMAPALACLADTGALSMRTMIRASFGSQAPNTFTPSRLRRCPFAGWLPRFKPGKTDSASANAWFARVAPAATTSMKPCPWESTAVMPMATWKTWATAVTWCRGAHLWTMRSSPRRLPCLPPMTASMRTARRSADEHQVKAGIKIPSADWPTRSSTPRKSSVGSASASGRIDHLAFAVTGDWKDPGWGLFHSRAAIQA